MKIREFQPRDINQVISLLKESKLYHKPWDNQKNYIKKKKTDPDLMLVAEEDNKIVGFVLGQYDGWGPMIWRLAVSKAKQNKGIGTMLANQIEKRLKNKGARNIYVLATLNNKKSMEFFKKRRYYTDTKCWTMGKVV